MCGCEPTFVCSRCSGDARQDHRLQWERDPAEDRDDAARDRDREAHLARIGGGAWALTK